MVFGFGSSKKSKSNNALPPQNPAQNGIPQRPLQQNSASPPIQRPIHTVPVGYKRSNTALHQAAKDSQLRRDQRPLPPASIPAYRVNESTDPTMPNVKHHPVADCDKILDNAPYPTNLKPKGRRPHGHMDQEGHFPEDKARLRAQAQINPPIPGHGPRKPVMWAYPNTTKFDYAQQNGRGQMPPELGGTQASGPTRIVTDHRKNQVGMVNHADEHGSFVRCDEVRMPMRGVNRTWGNS